MIELNLKCLLNNFPENNKIFPEISLLFFENKKILFGHMLFFPENKKLFDLNEIVNVVRRALCHQKRALLKTWGARAPSAPFLRHWLRLTNP
jgi:hypothetical protein